MEQSIDSNTKPEFAAGTDPAYIPGLTAPVPARSQEAEADVQDAVPEESDSAAEPFDDSADVAVRSDADGTAAETGSEDGTADTVPADKDVSADKDGIADKDASADEDRAADEDESDAPVFEISDRRGSIRVDKEGIRFTLDDQEAEFDWSEVSAVEVKTARLARRFTLTVHVSTRRWFNAEVEAESRSRLKEWPDELDVVLDAYFEES